MPDNEVRKIILLRRNVSILMDFQPDNKKNNKEFFCNYKMLGKWVEVILIPNTSSLV